MKTPHIPQIILRRWLEYDNLTETKPNPQANSGLYNCIEELLYLKDAAWVLEKTNNTPLTQTQKQEVRAQEHLREMSHFQTTRNTTGCTWGRNRTAARCEGAAF